MNRTSRSVIVVALAALVSVVSCDKKEATVPADVADRDESARQKGKELRDRSKRDLEAATTRIRDPFDPFASTKPTAPHP